MIRVQKGQAPPVLAANAATWTKDLLAAKAAKAAKKIESRYQSHEVKAALVRDFHGKCAYCESFIRHVDYGDIEHFRPKANPKWRHLTFDWNNLLLACGRCNGRENKGTRFPEASEDGPIVNPCEEEPSDHLRFEFEPAAKLASVYGRTPRGVTTEQVLGLNRKELRAERSRQVARLAVLRDFANTNSEAAEIWAEAQSAGAQYAAFARSVAAS